MRDNLRNAVRAEQGEPVALGSRIAARFAEVGLVDDIPELRGEPVHGVSVPLVPRAAVVQCFERGCDLPPDARGA